MNNMTLMIDKMMTDSRDAIESSTVYIQPLDHDNRSFGTRYYGVDADLVTKRAKRAVEEINRYRSPSMSRPYKYHGYTAVDVNWYSVD